jgi:hypothetical protein
MARSARRSVEMNETPAFEHPIEDGGRQIFIVEYLSPLIEWFVGREDHGPLPQVPILHHMERTLAASCPYGDTQPRRFGLSIPRISTSKTRLEDALGAGVSLFAYPFGGGKNISEENRDLVRQAAWCPLALAANFPGIASWLGELVGAEGVQECGRV